MSCALSGQIPEDPVFSPTGYIFERSLILKYLEVNQKCPITGEPLKPENLISLKVNKTVKPRIPSATSIPSLVQTFQNEWDAVMLEAYTQRQQLETARQELAHALYEHDAACRVIARLTRERDEARKALATAQAQLAEAASKPTPMEVEDSITDEIKQKISDFLKDISAKRKKRSVADLPQPQDLPSYSSLETYPLHKTTEPGIHCLDIHPNNSNLILTGGADKLVNLFNRSSNKKLASLSGHTKKITSVQFHPTVKLLFSSSADKTARFWSYQGEEQAVLKGHNDVVVGLTLHGTGDYLVTASADGTWAFNIIEGAKQLALVHSPDKAGFTCVNFHPDGLILATGTTNNLLRIWDVRSQSNIVTFEGHSDRITDVAFSENGYFMGSSSDDGCVKLWDLRKKEKTALLTSALAKPTSLDFDYSGIYLAAAAGNEITVFTAKTLEKVIQLNDHKDTVTDVKWARDATYLASTSLDRNLKVFGKPSKNK